MSDFFGDSAAGVAKRIKIIKATERKNGVKALWVAGRLVLNESNAQVPHEEGDFERGGRVTVDAEALQAAVSYRDTAYKGQAADLHEDMEMRHDSGRNAKFLELAMRACADRVRVILGKHMRMDVD